MSLKIVSQFPSLLEHVQHIVYVLLNIHKSFHMILHPNHQNLPALFVLSAKSVFSSIMQLFDVLSISTNLVRFRLVIPLHPFLPHFKHILLFKVSRYTEFSSHYKVSVEVFVERQVFSLILFIEKLNHLTLICLYLCKLTVRNAQRILLFKLILHSLD